ncbi:MAG: GNAT family N-acetyltransferase [Aquificae bacterium]|nr:GNAT family N-acetyltransferase [Aquificota bacterium]
METETLTLKPVRKEELNKLAELYLKAYEGLESYAYTHPSDALAYMEWLYRRDPEGFLVLKDGERPVGFVAADANWFSKRARKRVGAVHELVVDPSYRGRGLGKMLLKKALEYFKSKGLDEAELWVGDENERAISLYRKEGFKEEGRYNYWVRMVKKL